MIRECYPESVLLGSVDHPVEISQTCSPVTVETDGTIAACICREDFCNGIEYELSQPGPSNDTSHQASVLHSHWSRKVEARLSLVESFIVLLRQLSYAIKNQLGHPKPPTRVFACSSLVLYGIRELA